MQFVILMLALFYPLTLEAKSTLVALQKMSVPLPPHSRGFEVVNDGVWTVDNITHDIKKIALPDGSILESIRLPFQDDVADLIVLKNGFFVSSGKKIHRLKKDGSIIHTIEFSSTDNLQHYSLGEGKISWDGRALWIIANDFRLHRINKEDGKIEKTLYLSIPQEYSGLTDLSFSNDAIWISTGSSIYKISPDFGVVLSIFSLPGKGWGRRNQLDFMDNHLWVYGGDDMSIYNLPDSPGAPNFNPETNWFKPELIDNNDTICIDVLKETTSRFYSDKNIENLLYLVPLLSYGSTLPDGRNVAITIEGTQLYIDTFVNSGCGGACETYTLKASTLPFSEKDRWSFDEKAILQPEPPASANPFLTMINGRYFLPVVEDNNLNIFELKSDHWKTACKIRVKPENIGQFNDETSLDLQLGFRGGSGYGCGSMATHSRWGRAINQNIQQTFYQPWALHEYGCSKDMDGCYENDMLNLEIWSLTGISEYNAYHNHLEHFETAVEKLTRFYTKHNGWSKKGANAIAREALETAVSSGTRFYMYDPFPYKDRAIRQAILQRDSLDSIKQILANELPDSSLLHISTFSPEVTRYLLERGANPNETNDFGKTALMYAAQYNQLETARVLLEKGADPNAATFIPRDHCSFTLKTDGMTALHYATRYASADVIKLLIQHDAAVTNKTRNVDHADAPSYPIDWLHFYTADNSPEKNPNIPMALLAELESILAIPDPQKIPEISHQLTLDAEKHYKEGNLQLAYVNLRKAISLPHENLRAEADMSLVALKMGNLGESLKLSTKLVRSANVTDQMKANAWFNIGLACEKKPSTSYALFHQDQSYCHEGNLLPFLTAYSLNPSESRMKKVLENVHHERCNVTYHGKEVSLISLNPKPKTSFSKFIIMHPSGLEIVPEEFSWKYAKKDVQAQIADSHPPLGDLEITVIRSEKYPMQFPIQINNFQCINFNSPAISR